LRGLVNKVNAIVNHQIKARIVIATGIVVGQVLAAERDDARIDFHHGDGFNGLMAGHFTQHCAVAAADNQNVLRVAVRQQRNVGHHLVIDKLVALGGLHHAVQRHHAAKGGVLEDDEILVIGFLMIEHVINGKVLTKLVMQCFMPQRVVGHTLTLLC
jgi:hypothetical protein